MSFSCLSDQILNIRNELQIKQAFSLYSMLDLDAPADHITNLDKLNLLYDQACNRQGKVSTLLTESKNLGLTQPRFFEPKKSCTAHATEIKKVVLIKVRPKKV